MDNKIRMTNNHYFMFPGTIGIERLPKYLVINIVKNEICRLYSITMNEIQKGGKAHVEPRHIIAYLLKKMLGNKITLHEIGKEINRDHASAIHATRKIANWMDTQKDFKEKMNKIELSIKLMI